MAYDYASFSTLAGPLREPPAQGVYHVAYRKIMVGRHLYQVLPQLIATVGGLCRSLISFQNKTGCARVER